MDEGTDDPIDPFPSDHAASARERPRSRGDIVFEKLVVAVLAGATLAIVNHLFWQRQDRSKKQDFYFQEKTKVYSQISSELTQLIVDLNSRVDQSQSESSDKTVVARLDDKIDDDLVKLSTQLSYLKVYFAADAVKKADDCRGVIGAIDRTATEFHRPDSPLGHCAQELSDLLAAETRQEFAEFSR